MLHRDLTTMAGTSNAANGSEPPHFESPDASVGNAPAAGAAAIGPLREGRLVEESQIVEESQAHRPPTSPPP